MKERPILFSAPMVRAILDGRKTQTRRIVNLRDLAWMDEHQGLREPCNAERCPYGQPGDRLWVRESGWERPERTSQMMREGADTWAPYYYAADGEDGEQLRAWGFKVRPSIHMPRWASRITLEITSVRVERLNDISPDDAIEEGLKAITKDGKTVKYGIPDHDGRPGTDDIGWPWQELRISPVDAFRHLWESINGAGSWAANPWVWVVEFKRLEGGAA